MPKVVDNGKTNPAIVVSADEVKAWLRRIADDVGYADRATVAVQLRVETPFDAENFHNEAPELLLMVSNLPHSKPADLPSGPAKLAADLRAAYEKCKQWPEDTPAGQVALLEIRNMVPEIISVLERCAEHHKGTG